MSLVGISLVGGCGRETANEGVVPPPDVAATEAETAETADTSEAPGRLELPPGEIPAESTPSESPASGGIEMPRDVAVPDNEDTAPAEQEGAAAAGQQGASASPVIQYASWEEIQSLAKSQGRVTVVDLWSLACEPCLKEFPGLVRLHQTMGSKVQCIAVDLDYDGRKSRPPEYYQEQVLEFLQSVGASGFPTYISSTPSDDVFAAANVASIPAVLVFDAEGELAKVFVDAGESAGFTYEKDILPLVKDLAG